MRKSLLSLCRSGLDNLIHCDPITPFNAGQIRLISSGYHDHRYLFPLPMRTNPKISTVVRTSGYSSLAGQITRTNVSVKDPATTCSFSTSSGEEPLLVEKKDQVLWLKFNRPNKFNAVTLDMYQAMIDHLTKANSDPEIKVVVITGVGKYFSSGNDLTNFLKMQANPGGFAEGAKEGVKVFKRFIDTLINLEKFAIGAVNGPAVGFTCTLLPLLDYVMCSESATFYTPFTSLGQSPEACSTVTFPKIMGTSRASELLLMNKTFTADKAKSSGLVSDVVPNDKFESTLNELLYGEDGIVKGCYPESLKKCKAMIKDNNDRQKLLEVNEIECNTLLGTWMGDEVQAALVKFYTKAANKKK